MAQNRFATLYRLLYRIAFSVCLRRLDSDPHTGELTTRYLRQSNHYTSSNGRVKARAFHPNPTDHKVSIFRVQGLSEKQIWGLADIFVVASGNILQARADLFVAQITSANLRVESAEPPPRHANIVGWSREKHEWMSQAQEIAAFANLRLRAK
jgi:hypothetical protein